MKTGLECVADINSAALNTMLGLCLRLEHGTLCAVNCNQIDTVFQGFGKHASKLIMPGYNQFS